MKFLFAVLAAAFMAAMSVVAPSAPAFAMGQTAQIPKGNTRVPDAAKNAMANFNACVSREYVAGRDRAVDDAMGAYRDEYTLVTRSVTATNYPAFLTHARNAQVLAQDVGTTCRYTGPAL